MQSVEGAALHGADNDVHKAVGRRQEIHVSNAEARLLHDGGMRSRRVRHDGMHLPWVYHLTVHLHHLVGVREHVEHLRCSHWWVGLVDKPGCRPRAGEVHLPAQDIKVLHAVLQACPNVLHCEGAVADDGDHLAWHVRVVKAHLHRVVHGAAEELLALVVDWPRVDQGARPHADARDHGLEGLPARVLDARVALGDVFQLVVHAPQLVGQRASALHALPLKLDGLSDELVVAVPVSDLADHLHVLHVDAQVTVGDDAVLLGAQLKVLHELVPRGPDLMIHGRATTLLDPRHGELGPVPDVIGRELRLQFCGLVGHFQPRMPTHAVIAIEHDVVVRAFMR
mmetsp:Transcript_113608/g.352833  ORF Transcript_113608/g.352833 Transcript_113608/m.352833 type:complete len:339 (+) Transcript_113608:809-1825(+)